jgi:hypothetical protein
MRTPITFLLLALILAGCVSTHQDRAARAIPPYVPHNIVKKDLPRGFIRVALLPIVANPSLGSRESINSIGLAITEELGKAKRFEIIGITGDRLRDWGLPPAIDSIGPWPDELRQHLKGCRLMAS